MSLFSAPMRLPLLASLLLLGASFVARAKEASKLYERSVRASVINPLAQEHPEIKFTFAEVKGKHQDLQHAIVDTRVAPRDRLVIWLMSYNGELSEYLASLGLHLIQPHYANRWFSTVPKETHDTGECLGNIRLEAATGEDHSPLVVIPKPDGLAARSLNFVQVVSQGKPTREMGSFPQ